MRSMTRVLALLVLVAWPGLAAARQAPTLTPPDTLVIDGVPPIPVSVEKAMAPYFQYRKAIFVAWHPVRREILIGTTFGDTQQIHHVAMPGGARTQLTFFDDGIGGGQRAIPIEASYEPQTGAYFVFQKDVDGKERYQLYRYDVATGVITMLTDGQSINEIGAWSHAGDRMAYTSTRRDGRDFDLYVMNPAAPSGARLVAENEGTWSAVDWSADDRAVLAIEYRSAAESRLWRVDVETGEKTPIAPLGAEHVSFGDARLAPDGRSVYVTTDAGSEYLRLARLDLATGRMTHLTDAIAGDVEDFAVSPDGRTAAVVVNEQGAGALHLLDLATGKEQPAPKLPPGRVAHLSWRPNSEELAFEMRSVRSDWDVYSVHIRTGRLDRWTASETGGLNAEALAQPELIHWKSFDGLTISGFMYRPPARFTGKRPVMINIHGGPQDEARPGWQGFSNYFLNELGVAIIYPNVRGSTGFGKTFMGLDDGLKRDGATKDIGALLDWIAAQPELDKDRVMVTGASFGGYLTLAVAAEYNDRIRCSFAGFSISNLVTDLEHTNPASQDERRREYGDERDPKVRAFLESIAPVNHASEITRPIFIAHGRNDPRVPVTESEQMVAAIKKNGGTVWYIEATNEGHGFGRRPNVTYLVDAWAYFMQKFLVE
jgi:dipeptidyl aminopeptidase/acylaminoacyl peptidase